MTTPPFFPQMPGLSWGVHKRPTFSTRVAAHTSGRETRAGLFAHALYEFELAYEGLDSFGQFPGLQTNSLQTLLGFFLTCQGQLNTFLYVDPTDNAATNQGFGVGDGVTTVFTLARAIGGFNEPISYALNPNSPTQINYGAVGGGLDYLPNNLIPNSTFVGAAAGTPGSTPTGWGIGPDTAHGLSRQIVGVGTVGGLPYIDVRIYGTDTNSGGNLALNMNYQSMAATSGQSFIASASLALQAGTLPGNVSLVLYDGSVYHMSVAAVTGTLTPFYFANTPTYSGMASVDFEVWAYGPTTAGSAVDFTLRIAAPQLELVLPAQQTTPNPFMPTFGAAYYGAPQISVNGVVVNPTSYTFTAPNTITFTAAPAAAAVIAWNGTYSFQCRFLDDQIDFENFMSGAWSAQSLKFRQVR